MRRDEAAWVVLPTYNEAENIEGVVAATRDALTNNPHRILIVDDGSPDGTGEIANQLCARHDDVEVLHRTVKEGLGPAYRAGFRRALDGGAALVCEMDSDFSHSPSDLPRLIAAAEAADVVIGSRWVEGGEAVEWSRSRRALSLAGSTYARRILGLKVRDLTGGFKCMRREVLESVDLDAMRSTGYAHQIELTYRAIVAGFTVVEVPIRFCDRELGASKMSAGITAEALWRVPALRREARRLARGSAVPLRSSTA